MNTGTLYVVSTPIGNLEDITLRALRVLKEVDYIVAEDTRVTKKLLSHYGIHTATKRFDAHKERGGVEMIVNDIEEGKSVALVSDAGTPAISDPGIRLVQAARTAQVPVVSVPGASSLVAALSIAGLPTDNVLFLGFIPHKKGRKTFLTTALGHDGTAVFFESTHRIETCLQELSELSPQYTVVLARKLTKMHEEVLVGTAEELLAIFSQNPVKKKGEFVVLLSPLSRE
jgi:16S rRNA (cytidine1402-2'-O)-methyltransferase